MITTSYRPRNPGHDYYGRGTYLITLVVSDRLPLLGRLADDVKHPQVALSPLGQMVKQAWEAIPGKQAAHGNRVAVHACVCMPDYARQHQQWVDAIIGGTTVIVTPGISRGELMMKNECLKNGYPLIHLQKEPITPYWKPERMRFDACANGSLLILAPWGLDAMAAVNGVPADTDYSRFHNMNHLAAEICNFNGSATILR